MNEHEPGQMVDRLVDATNRHDLDALVDCFAEDYRNETPVHPARGFSGRDQVRRNWTQIFAGVPDVQARVIARVTSGDTVWSEWEMGGTRRDGAPHRMRGVILFTVRDGRASSARFYLEIVDDGSTDVTHAVHQATGTSAQPPQ